MNRAIGLLSLFLFVTGCASGPRPQNEKSKTEIQPPAPESGRGVACPPAVRGVCVPQHPVSILQSLTSNEQSRFTLVIPKGARFSYLVRDARGTVRALKAERFERAHSNRAVDQVEARDLKVGEAYELFVVGGDGTLWDRRNFRALDLGPRRVRLAIISCMDDRVVEIPQKMWPLVEKQAPDAIFMIGDNVYGDHMENGWKNPTPAELWDRYVETREDLPFYRWSTLVPVFAVWDDHDFGVNNADRTFPYKNESLEIFFTFFAQRQPGPGFERGPGVSSYLRAWGAEFAILDDRFFRTPNNVDLPDQTHLGVEQENWLNAHLRAAERPVFLVEGDQFFGGYHPFESFEGSHPKSFKAQLPEWRKARVPLFFVSGDRHLTEIMRTDALGYRTYEMTSSGIHASTFRDAFVKNPSPNQIAGVAGEYNFSILEILRSEKQRLEVSVTAFGIDQKLLYQKTMTVKHP